MAIFQESTPSSILINSRSLERFANIIDTANAISSYKFLSLLSLIRFLLLIDFPFPFNNYLLKFPPAAPPPCASY